MCKNAGAMVIWWASVGHVEPTVWWRSVLQLCVMRQTFLRYVTRQDGTMSLRPQELTDWCRVIISVQGVCSRAGCWGPRPTCGSIHTPSTVKDWQTHILNIYSIYGYKGEGEVYSRTIQNDFENCFLKKFKFHCRCENLFHNFPLCFCLFVSPTSG